MTMSSTTERATRREAKRLDPTRVSFGKLVAWSSSHASYAANVLFLGFFTIYCTDTLQLSAPVVGLLLLLSRFVDAVGALVAGWLVDVAPETRFGKARPFDLAIVGIWIFTAVMFSVPGGLGEVAKYVWVFISYLLVTAVFTPLFNANQPLYMARAFANRDVYTKLSARSGLIVGAVALLAGVSVPILVQQAGKTPEAWSIVSICVAAPLAVFGLLRFFTIREIRNTEAADSPRVRMRDIMLVLRTNPYLWMLSSITLLGSVVGSVGVGAYYFRYIVGNLAIMGVFGIVNILALPVLALLPPLVRRFSVSRVIAGFSLIGALGFSLYAFAGANIPLLLIAALLTAVGALPASFLATVLVIDNATYNEWKGNRRLESVGGGVQSFAQSAGSGLAAGLAGLVLGVVGYNGAHNTQSATAIGGIVLLMSWIPAGLSVLVCVIALLYNRFERRLPELTEQIEFRKTGGIPVGTSLLDPTQVNANPNSALLASGEELVGTVEAKLRKHSRNRGERR